MNTEVSIETIMWGIALIATLAVLYLAGNFLVSAQGLVDEKAAMARKGLEAIDVAFAEGGGVVGTVVHDVAAGVNFKPEDAAILAVGNIVAEGLKMMNKVLPDTPDRIEPAVLASVANDVAATIARLTDKVKGNAFVETPPKE